MATIKDIAQACKVAKSTVSRYLNQSGYVSEDVAKRIEAKILELNYVPSATARNLTTKKSNVIGVVFPEVDNPFFAEVFKGISHEADANDLSIFYCDTDNNAAKELKALEMLRRYEIDGLILTPATGGQINQRNSDEFIHMVTLLKVPVVLLDRDVPYVHWDGVFTDNFKGAYEATNALLDAGHQKIATISGDLNLKLGRDRFNGYKKALKDRGLNADPSFIFKGDFTTETAYIRMNEILSQRQEVTAIFSPNNLTTLGIIKAAFEKGLSIPEDLALVGFDDIEMLNTLNLNISVASRDTNQMGKKAMELLMARLIGENLKEEALPKRVVLEPEIIMRGSEKKL